MYTLYTVYLLFNNYETEQISQRDFVSKHAHTYEAYNTVRYIYNIHRSIIYSH